ncbi:MAG TPA: electron transport complex subunit RsxE [Phycisphaerae bacterium]|nr:electron transport complex subunit RsxE [Phycisphaerae bacterium]
MSLLRDFADKPIKANPVFVLVLGLCPTLAVSTSVQNAVAMAAAATAVLIGSNVLISLIRRFIPNQIRIVCYIVVIAGFVTMVEIIMKALAPQDVNKALGIFIPLIVVNCIILGRAEGFASRHGALSSLADALGIGLGYLGALLSIAVIREILGAGTLWGYRLTPITLAGRTLVPEYQPANILVMAPGAFLVIGLLFGFFHWIGNRRRERARLAGVPAIAQTARDLPKPKKHGAGEEATG